jgi:hypothetical protein
MLPAMPIEALETVHGQTTTWAWITDRKITAQSVVAVTTI